MKRKLIISALFVTVLVVCVGCAALGSAGHKYLMKGAILDVYGKEAYLCIGTADGAQVGQTYAAYRFSRVLPSAGKAKPTYIKKLVGEVKITEVVHEHYAKATVLNGQVRENDVVELNP